MLMMSITAHAQIPNINIEKFQGSYNAPNGNATAQTFVYENTDFGANPTFDMFIQAGELVLNTPDDEIRVQSLPGAVEDWESLEVENIDLKSNDSKILLDSGKISFKTHKGKESYISGLKIDCSKTQKNLVDGILDLCLNQKMTAYLPGIKDVSISSLNLWATDNRLNFSFKNSVWIKGHGKIWYHADQKLIKIRIDKAKAGFFNVTGKVFAELKAQENDFIKVNRPYVEITLP